MTRAIFLAPAEENRTPFLRAIGRQTRAPGLHDTTTVTTTPTRKTMEKDFHGRDRALTVRQ